MMDSGPQTALRTASRSIWLWMVAGCLVGGGLMMLLVASLGGVWALALQGALSGATPGAVLLASARWRPASQPVAALNLRSLGVVLVLLLGILAAAIMVDTRLAPGGLGPWSSRALGFAGASLGGVVPPVLYDRQHQR